MASKVIVIQQWPTPRSTKALCSFLGLAGFYRRFIRGYGTIAAPLVKATTIDPFQWSPSAQTAFECLKEALSTAPVLALPDFSKPFTLETDASGVGMGVVLSQQGLPIAFFSKPFTSKLLRLSTYVWELCAITTAVRKWRQYLLGHHFTIITDHRSLMELLGQVIQTPEQHMYMARLMGYDYDIQYHAGASNQAADALSRLPDQQPSMAMLLSVPCLSFLKELCAQLDANEEYGQLRRNILLTPHNYSDFSVTQNLVLHKNRIWIPRDLPIITTLL